MNNDSMINSDARGQHNFALVETICRKVATLNPWVCSAAVTGTAGVISAIVALTVPAVAVTCMVAALALVGAAAVFSAIAFAFHRLGGRKTQDAKAQQLSESDMMAKDKKEFSFSDFAELKNSVSTPNDLLMQLYSLGKTLEIIKIVGPDLEMVWDGVTELDLAGFPNLQELCIWHGQHLRALHNLGSCKNLRILGLDDEIELAAQPIIDAVKKLHKLEEIYLGNEIFTAVTQATVDEIFKRNKKLKQITLGSTKYEKLDKTDKISITRFNNNQ